MSIQKDELRSPEESKRYQFFGTSTYSFSRKSRLWRYLTFEKFVWLLEFEKLHHVRLDLLDDKYEGAVTKIFDEKGYTGLMQGIQTKEGIYYTHAEAVAAGLIPEYTVSERNRDRRARELFRNSGYVSCWSTSDYESDSMWKAYANSKTGVAIVSTPQRIVDAADLTDVPWGILGPVEYFDFEKDDMLLDFGRFGRAGFSKRKEFETEKEVRGLIYRYPHVSPLSLEEDIRKIAGQMPREVSVHVDLDVLIEEIYVSPSSQNWFFDLVCSLSTRHGLGERVRQSTLGADPRPEKSIGGDEWSRYKR